MSRPPSFWPGRLAAGAPVLLASLAVALGRANPAPAPPADPAAAPAPGLPPSVFGEGGAG